MNMKIVQGCKFYIDDLTRKLSAKYDVMAYKGWHCVLAKIEKEQLLGRIMFLAQLCGEFGGVDFETYMYKFSNETSDSYPYTDIMKLGRKMFTEEAFRFYAGCHPEYFHPSEDLGLEIFLRIEKLDSKTVYFPKEELIKTMMRGIKL